MTCPRQLVILMVTSLPGSLICSCAKSSMGLGISDAFRLVRSDIPTDENTNVASPLTVYSVLSSPVSRSFSVTVPSAKPVSVRVWIFTVSG